MAKLAAYPSFVNSAPPSLPSHIRRQINARATCPWCGSPMHLNRAGTRLQCVDSIHCAGVLAAERNLPNT
ncbi:MAG: hypothetical protein EXS58_10075 [Candidatus Latescibacteria bacterium]|nr:hypothetical protein [Candidatus Latescibacterota bacterium]